MLILIGGLILLKNSDFQSRNAKSLDFGPESKKAILDITYFRQVDIIFWQFLLMVLLK